MVVIALSMVFSEIVPLWGFLGPKTMLIGFATRLVVGSRGASGVLSMVFGRCGRFPEVSLVFWTGVFLSPGRKNLCDRKGNRPKAG